MSEEPMTFYQDVPSSFRMAEARVDYFAPPSRSDEAMSVEIDAILDQLALDIPCLQREMDDILAKVRVPGIV